MIIHLDMDAFYASVEERENPTLQGRPLVVAGAASARGVVSAASYAARRFGICSAMPTAQALKKCRSLIVLPPRGALYAQVSNDIHAIMRRYTPVIQPLSLDEAFLDASGSERLYGDSIIIGRKIKREILAELSLVASVGIAPNRFLAKLASDHEKPDGFTVIHEDNVQAFLDAMPVVKIPGVGSKTRARLAALGVVTVRELREYPESFLVREFGSHGSALWRLARGIDDRPVMPDADAKSISHETTFAVDTADIGDIESAALALTEDVGYRLRRNHLFGRTVSIKLRTHSFKTLSRSITLPRPTASTAEIWLNAKRLIAEILNIRAGPFRLVGVAVSGFAENAATGIQEDIFQKNNAHDGTAAAHAARVDEVADHINSRFGRHSIKRGRSISKDDQ